MVLISSFCIAFLLVFERFYFKNLSFLSLIIKDRPAVRNAYLQIHLQPNFYFLGTF